MGNQLHKRKVLFVIAGGIFILVIIITVAIFVQNQANEKLSTPMLIDKAFVEGKISEEQRLLYLAYAIYEYESLPTQFRGNAGWRGTSTVEELSEAANSPALLCSMSPDVRNEFQRLLNSKTICD